MHESRGEIHGLSGAEAQNKPHFVDVIVLLSFKCSMFLFSWDLDFNVYFFFFAYVSRCSFAVENNFKMRL